MTKIRRGEVLVDGGGEYGERSYWDELLAVVVVDSAASITMEAVVAVALSVVTNEPTVAVALSVVTNEPTV